MAKIVNVPARALVSYVLHPTARLLLRLGVTPNAVTVAGTVGVLGPTRMDYAKVVPLVDATAAAMTEARGKVK